MRDVEARLQLYEVVVLFRTPVTTWGERERVLNLSVPSPFLVCIRLLISRLCSSTCVLCGLVRFIRIIWSLLFYSSSCFGHRRYRLCFGHENFFGHFPNGSLMPATWIVSMRRLKFTLASLIRVSYPFHCMQCTSMLAYDVGICNWSFESV